MAIVQFTIEKLQVLDGGKAALTFNKLLQQAAEDCWQRPGDKGAREVALTMSVFPVICPDGQIERVELAMKITSKIPAHKTNAYSMSLRAGGKLAFNPDSPHNVSQGTLLSDDDDDEDDGD